MTDEADPHIAIKQLADMCQPYDNWWRREYLRRTIADAEAKMQADAKRLLPVGRFPQFEPK